MELNSSTLALLTQAVNAAFMQGLEHKTAPWELIAARIPSTTGENVYPYVKQLGNIRKWVGDRVIQNLAKGEFRLANEDFEETHGVSRNAVMDDQFGVYMPQFVQMGRNVRNFPSKYSYALLKAGFTTLGPDGQFFFDTDHPVGRPGQEASVSNHMGGAGAPWFVVDASQAVKPLIYQPRKDFDLVALFNPTDPNVFFNKQFIYGVDGRAAFGFGPFWQLAFASKQAIDETNMTALLDAMASQLDDNGEPLGVGGTHFIGTPVQCSLAKKVLMVEKLAGGADNPLYRRLEIVECPWLL
jgi:phage major head subunit gpT-like protein